MESSFARFHYRLHTLPQELYDQIYNLTFTATPSVCNLGCTDEDYPELVPDPIPHHLLAVDSVSRAQFAKSYYSNTTFVTYLHFTLCNWLDSLPIEHRHFLKDVRMIHYLCDPPADPLNAYIFHSWYAQTLQEILRDAYGDRVMDIVQCGTETEVTKDLEDFITSSERIAAARAASTRPDRKAFRNCYRIQKLQRGFRARFRRT